MPKAVTKSQLRPALAIIGLFAWIVLVIPIATAIAVFVALGTIPGYIARKRGHPWAEAVTVRGRHRRGETTIDPARVRFATELMMRIVFRMHGGSISKFQGVLILLMLVTGCGKAQPPSEMPRPFPGATLFREELACGPAINAAMVDLMAVLRKDLGNISIERFSLPLNADYTQIVDYYRRQLPNDWQAEQYPPEHAAYRLAVWSAGSWTRRYLALALLNDTGCPEHLPYQILLVAVPTEE
jgi:hypothetical protein